MQDYFEQPTEETIVTPVQPDANMATPQPSKKRGKLWIYIGCVAVVAIAAVLAVKLFLNPMIRIGIAMANTFKGKSQIEKDLDISDIFADGNASVKADVEYDYKTVSMSGVCDFSDKHKALSLKANGDLGKIGDFEVDFTAELDADKLAVSLNPAIDKTLAYYYTRDNKGYIISNIKHSAKKISEINDSLKNFYEFDFSDFNTNDIQSAIVKAVLKEAKNIEIEKVDEKEKFKINGKMRKCGGYQMELTEEDMEAMVDAARKAAEKELKNASAEGYMRDWLEDYYDDMFDDLEDGISWTRDVDLSFYIYGSQIACIRVEASLYTADIIFHGGDYPTQNIEVMLDGGIYSDYVVMELKGDKKDKIEKMELDIDEDSIFELEYNTKNGELSVESDMADIEFEAAVKRTKKELAVDIDDINGVALTLTITDGGTVESIKGEEFNVGEADEDDVEDLVEDIFDEYGDLVYYIYQM